MVLEERLEPRDLHVVDGHLVTRVPRVPEHRRPHPHEQRLFCDLPAELRRGLVVHAEVHGEVFLVRLELVDALQVLGAAIATKGEALGREQR